MKVQDFAKVLINKFHEYKSIALFVHVNPDFDAFASAFGLKQWLNDNFKEIKTYLMIPKGTINPKDSELFHHEEDLPSPNVLSESLGIVVDTANKERVLTGLYSHCKELIVIDHHPQTQSFADLEFVDPTYPAASQILAEMFFYWESEEGGNYTFKEIIAQYLYAGIITDTNNFMSMSMLPSTYQVLSQLVSRGLNRSFIHGRIFEKTLKQKFLEREILKKCFLTKNGLIFSIIGPKTIKKYHAEKAPNMVSVLENVADVEVWSTLTYNIETKNWNCSIRSKNLTINTVAKEYGGGGHKKMAAAIFKKQITFFRMMATLDKLLESHGFDNCTIRDSRINKKLRWIQFLGFYKKV